MAWRGIVCVVFALSSLPWVPTSAVTQAAGSIVIDTELDVAADDGLCSLREALTAANTDSAVGGCPAGSGRDVLTFAFGGEIIVLASDLPRIGSELAIDGGGNTIDSDNRSAQVNAVVRVNQGATAEVSDLAITGAYRGTDGGAIENLGTLTARRVHVYGNRGDVDRGTFSGIDNQGEMWLIDSEVTANTGRTAVLNSGTLRVTGTTIHDNDGTGLSSGGQLELDDSEILRNRPASEAPWWWDFGGLLISGSSRSSTISNTLVAGNEGPGLYLDGEVLVTDSIVEHNRAEAGGGAYVDGRDVRFVRVQVSDNVATNEGGGIYVHFGGVLTIEDSLITRNTSETGDGGGIAVSGGVPSDLTLRNSSVRENRAAQGSGGGVSCARSCRLEGVVVEDNVATDGGGLSGGRSTVLVDGWIADNVASGSGGGLSGEFDIQRTSIVGNAAGEHGGGADLERGSTLSESLVAGNTAEGNGGGVHSPPCGCTAIKGPRMVNTTVSGNTAAVSGGGIWGEEPVLIFATVTDNAAPAGAGVALNSEAIHRSYAEIQVSIVAGNTGGGRDVESPGDDVTGTPSDGPDELASWNVFGSVGPNLERFLDDAAFVDVADPGLTPLADNGGSTWTHALTQTSPAVDRTRTSNFWPTHLSAPPIDGRGWDRPFGGHYDSGAFECHTCRPVVGRPVLVGAATVLMPAVRLDQ